MKQGILCCCLFILAAHANSASAATAMQRFGQAPNSAPRSTTAQNKKQQTVPTAYVMQSSQAPKIDGVLTDDVWKNAPLFNI
ncbi:MAG: hypothetical protein HRU15_10385, partial [Planctomycetes bacterium]|nr:hypothetical protein [Planctomycetota bacterium]